MRNSEISELRMDLTCAIWSQNHAAVNWIAMVTNGCFEYLCHTVKAEIPGSELLKDYSSVLCFYTIFVIWRLDFLKKWIIQMKDCNKYIVMKDSSSLLAPVYRHQMNTVPHCAAHCTNPLSGRLWNGGLSWEERKYRYFGKTYSKTTFSFSEDNK